jgi:hypothetical protein
MIQRNEIRTAKPLFSLGQIVATPGALKALGESGESGGSFLIRHQSGDWGEICAEDRAENELALEQGFRIMSVYQTAKGETLWIITEADRSSSCILTPQEY